MVLSKFSPLGDKFDFTAAAYIGTFSTSTSIHNARNYCKLNLLVFMEYGLSVLTVDCLTSFLGKAVERIESLDTVPELRDFSKKLHLLISRSVAVTDTGVESDFLIKVTLLRKLTRFLGFRELIDLDFRSYNEITEVSGAREFYFISFERHGFALGNSSTV